jgi:glycine cleavage system T protein (aminomethyltransferase)
LPIPSPLHDRTAPLCTSYRWKDWAGYYAVCSYDSYADREYYALRHAAGLMDVTPLHKYSVTGKDATAFLSYVVARNIARLAVGRVTYCCWCDDRGKLLDDGTVSRLDEDRYRVTAAEPSLAWFLQAARGFDVAVEDVTDSVAALSVQGPNSRALLAQACDAPLETLGFFRLAPARFDGVDAVVTRTGYTGDLGYELWADAADAVKLWDRVVDAGRDFGLQPTGLDALDVTRIEAGFVMNGVDYVSANHCAIEERMSTPYESGLGWTVNLKRAPFIGRDALREEKRRGPARVIAGLSIDWDETEALFRKWGLPPGIGTAAWRSPVPVYDRGGAQVGYATSGAWSPILKKNLAIATLRAPHGTDGEELSIEMTVEYVRHRVKATVQPRPFFDPERKRA